MSLNQYFIDTKGSDKYDLSQPNQEEFGEYWYFQGEKLPIPSFYTKKLNFRQIIRPIWQFSANFL